MGLNPFTHSGRGPKTIGALESEFHGDQKSKTNKQRLMTLPAEEFIRRFLQHVLPRGLQKVRCYGWMSRRQKQVLQKLKLLLGDVPCDELLKNAAESRPFTCPKCGRPMQVIGVLAPQRRAPPIAA